MFLSLMTQNEKWLLQYEQMMAFMNDYHRRPSKHRVEEHLLLNWFRHNEKLLKHGKMSAQRKEKFEALMEVAIKFRRINQYA